MQARFRQQKERWLQCQFGFSYTFRCQYFFLVICPPPLLLLFSMFSCCHFLNFQNLLLSIWVHYMTIVHAFPQQVDFRQAVGLKSKSRAAYLLFLAPLSLWCFCFVFCWLFSTVGCSCTISSWISEALSDGKTMIAKIHMIWKAAPNIRPNFSKASLQLSVDAILFVLVPAFCFSCFPLFCSCAALRRLCYFPEIKFNYFLLTTLTASIEF